MGAVPVHVPRFPVSSVPCTMAPEIVGALVFLGLADAAAVTAAVAFEATVLDPTEFVPVTRKRRRQPASAETRV